MLVKLLHSTRGAAKHPGDFKLGAPLKTLIVSVVATTTFAIGAAPTFAAASAGSEYALAPAAMGEIAGWVGHTGNGLGFQALTMYDARSGVVIAILLNGTGEDADLPAHVFREILTVMSAPAP